MDEQPDATQLPGSANVDPVALVPRHWFRNTVLFVLALVVVYLPAYLQATIWVRPYHNEIGDGLELVMAIVVVGALYGLTGFISGFAFGAIVAQLSARALKPRNEGRFVLTAGLSTAVLGASLGEWLAVGMLQVG